MEFQELIQKRQSVRSYTGDTVANDIIVKMIEAAQEAPSWKNSQTSRYYCISSPDKVSKFREETLPGFNQNSTANAAAYIVSTYKKNISGFDPNGNPDNELGNQWGAYDLGLHDMLLVAKATELGVATLIMGLRDSDQVASFCSIPEDEQVVSIIAVGYPDKITNKPPRKPALDIVKFI